jgi:periplasmic protein TonB
VASPASTASRSVEADGSALSSARAAGDLIAITVRDDFLLELGESLGGQAAVHPVDSLAAALAHLNGSKRTPLLAIDSRDVADLRGDVDRAHAQVPHVPVIVFASSDAEKTIAGALKSSNIFAVLPIPVDRRKTAAIIEGALADAAARKSTARAPEARSRDAGEIRFEARAPLTPEPAPFVPLTRSADSEPPAARKAAIGAAVAIAVAALAGGGYWLMHGSGSQPAATAAKSGTAPAAPSAAPTAAPEQAAPAPLVQGTLDELLEKARLAMRERRYTEPASNCALLYYRSALGVDPANGEARDGMGRLASLLMSRFDESLGGGRFDEAAAALASLKIASPGDSRLGSLESRLLQAEIAKAFADGNIDRATALIRQAQQSGAIPAGELARWRTELAKHQDESRAKHLGDLFAERLRDGRLVEPANDNAKYYLQQLKELAPSSPVAQHGARDLVAACLRKARDAAVANHASEADRWVAEARAAGMTQAELSAYQRDLASARQRAATAEADRLAQLARDRMQDGHLTDPANDSALYYLTQLKSGFGDQPAVGSVGREFATRLIERATAAAHAGQATAMNSDLALAKRWGADPALLQAVQQVLTGHGGRAPVQAARSSAPAIPAGFVPKRIRYTAPEYPERALDAHQSGSVTVEFTVDTKGQPRDVRVIEATPAGVFDRAATDAVKRWRYQPAVFDGVPTEIPTRMVIRFEAPK